MLSLSQRLGENVLAVLLVFIGSLAVTQQVQAQAPTPTSAASSLVVRDNARATIDLSGTWQTKANDGLSFNYPPTEDGWKNETVPHRQASLMKSTTGPYGEGIANHLNADKSGFLLKEIAAWFRRSVEVPNDWAGRGRVLLHIDGAAYRSDTWFNGQKLGQWVNGLVPVVYDVTAHVKAGQSNQVAIGLTGREGLIDIANKTFIAPPSGANPGIFAKVWLELVPDVFIDDAFIKTSVKNKRIDLEVTIRNSGSSARNVRPEVLVRDAHGQPELSIQGQSVTVPPGQSVLAKFGQEWTTARYWTHLTPNLYYAQCQLRDGSNNVTDSKTERFGFREFEIRGRDFYLNGERITLLRNSPLLDIGADWKTVQTLASEDLKTFNSMRLHGGFNNPWLLDFCDSVGMMSIPETAWHNGIPRAYNMAKDKQPLWLPNVQTYVKAWIKQNRNRPSVVMWSLTNEFMWGHTKPEYMEVAQAVLDAAKSMDTTRPFQGDAEVTWDGRLPIINIHYPEFSVANSLRARYPNSGTVFPNDFFWLKSDPESRNKTDRADFKWDRPLVLGEYMDQGFYDFDNQSSYFGELLYDWEKWRFQAIGGIDGREGSRFQWAAEGAANAYRYQGAAGMNPWGGDRTKILRPILARPLDHFPNMFGGQKNNRRVLVINDAGQSFHVMELQVRLTSDDGVTMWEKVDYAGDVGPGQKKVFDVEVEPPAVMATVPAKLGIRLRYNRGNTHAQLDWYEQSVFVMPMPSLKDVDASQIVLLDEKGQTRQALSRLGLTLSAKSSLTSTDLTLAKVVIVGQETNPTAFRKPLEKFVQDGGRVIVLRQEANRSFSPLLPDPDLQHISTRNEPRFYNHPILQGMSEEQFAFWRPDHLVSYKTFRKPASPSAQAILDCGGLYGLRWSSLMQVPYGSGLFLVTQLNLADRVDVEPAAATVLANMIRYAVSYSSSPSSTLRVLASGKEAPLFNVLKTADVDYVLGLDKGDGPILIDASANLTSDELAKAKAHLAKGGRVWMHGFDDKNISKVASLWPFAPKLVEYDKRVQAAVRRSSDPLMNNLSSFDFFWTKVDLIARGDFFNQAKPTAKLGGMELKLPHWQAGVRLVEPALLVKVPVGAGTILLDNIAWDGALTGESERAVRVAGSLAVNLGASLKRNADQTVYDYFPLDISRQANMGYLDRVADDGQGGWTDQGDNDMRFFLANHAGTGTGQEGALEVGAAEFPEQATFNNRLFKLLDPKKTNDHAIISLRGIDHGTQLPDKATGIVVNRALHKLWMLHSSGWAPVKSEGVVAKIVVHYSDGSDATIPIRYGIEVGDWWVPKLLTGGQIAWTGRNLKTTPVGVFTSEWTNPNPQKTIATIDVLGAQDSSQYLLLAITGGAAQSAGSSGRSDAGNTDGGTGAISGTGAAVGGIGGIGGVGEAMAIWDFSQVKNNQIPNQVAGGGPLFLADKKSPTPATVEGMTGLRFAEGQMLMGDEKQTSGLGDPQPFIFQTTLMIESKTDAYCSGIYQAMSYGTTGFRLVLLNGSMKLGVEICQGQAVKGKGMVSERALELNRPYEISLKFDGTHAWLLIDGQVDKMIECPLPAAGKHSIQVGVASGSQYNFYGVIKEIRISRLQK